MFVGLARDCHPPIFALAWEHPMGVTTSVAVTNGGSDLAVDRVIEQQRRDHVHRSLGLRKVKILALASATSVVESGEKSGIGESG